MAMFPHSQAQTLAPLTEQPKARHRHAATLAEMYAYAFRIQNTLERQLRRPAPHAQSNAGSGSGNRPSASRASLQTNPEASLQTRLQMTEAQYRAFLEAAQRFAPADDRITRQILALAAQDRADQARATHPNTRALTEPTRFQIDQLVQQRVAAAAKEEAALRNFLNVVSAAALDEKIAILYADPKRVAAPRVAQRTLAASPRNHPRPNEIIGDPSNDSGPIEDCYDDGGLWDFNDDECSYPDSGDGGGSPLPATDCSVPSSEVTSVNRNTGPAVGFQAALSNPEGDDWTGNYVWEVDPPGPLTNSNTCFWPGSRTIYLQCLQSHSSDNPPANHTGQSKRATSTGLILLAFTHRYSLTSSIYIPQA